MSEQAPPRPAHLLHIIDTLDPAAGGPSEVVRALFEFAPEGITAEVVTLDPPGAAFLSSCPFPVHALGRGLPPFGYSRPLDRWLRRNRDRFDGVLVHGLWRYIGIAARKAFRGRRPYVVFAHGMLDPYFKRRFPLKHLRKWLYWLFGEYRVLRDAHRVLFTTQEESRLARQSFWLHRWTPLVVPLGATRPLEDPETLQTAFVAAHPGLKDRRFLLFLGRIHRKKGCDQLIDAFLQAAPSDPGLHLVMAGPDQQGLRSGLESQVAAAGLAARVHWPGMLHGDVKWGAFFASEAFILPSHQENFGIAVAEALACGRPVLLSDKVNIAPEIASDHAGLMEPDTPAGTSRLLARWIALAPAQRAAMSAQALRTFNSRYDMQKNAASILRLFDDSPHPASQTEFHGG